MKENIQKVRRSFIHFEGFQGDLNPLSTRLVVETCVIPVLYCCENWSVTARILQQLEACLRELVKRWPKLHPNAAAVTALKMESVRFRLLVRKLGFLKRTMRDGMGAAAMRSMVDDVASFISGQGM